MSHAAVDRVPPEGQQCVVRTAYKDLVPMGLVGATRHEGWWFDVGTAAAYLQANMDVLHGRMVPAIDPWSIGRRGAGGSWVGREALVEGLIDGSLVGARAHVPDGARLRGCVVWDGVQVPPGDHVNCVIFGPPARPGMCHPGEVLCVGD
jgi:mannose-1-phosphate guanylyltransferase